MQPRTEGPQVAKARLQHGQVCCHGVEPDQQLCSRCSWPSLSQSTCTSIRCSPTSQVQSVRFSAVAKGGWLAAAGVDDRL